MCLHAENNKATVAEKDLICFKVTHIVTEKRICRRERIKGGMLTHYEYVSLEYPEFTSLWYDFTYKYGKTYECDKFKNRSLLYEITHGFHSWRDSCFNTAKMSCIGSNNEVILKCIIPKGTKYYYDRSHYCSQKIRVIGWKRPGERKWHTYDKASNCNIFEKIRDYFKEIMF